MRGGNTRHDHEVFSKLAFASNGRGYASIHPSLFTDSSLSPGKMCVTYTRSERACRERCSTTCFEFLIFDIERRPQPFSPLRRHSSFPDRFPLRFGTATAQWRLMASLARDTRAIDIEMDINRGGVKTRAFFHLVAWQVSRETQVLERIPSFLRTTLFEVFLFEKNPSRVWRSLDKNIRARSDSRMRSRGFERAREFLFSVTFAKIPSVRKVVESGLD